MNCIKNRTLSLLYLCYKRQGAKKNEKETKRKKTIVEFFGG